MTGTALSRAATTLPKARLVDLLCDCSGGGDIQESSGKVDFLPVRELTGRNTKKLTLEGFVGQERSRRTGRCVPPEVLDDSIHGSARSVAKLCHHVDFVIRNFQFQREYCPNVL